MGFLQSLKASIRVLLGRTRAPVAPEKTPAQRRLEAFLDARDMDGGLSAAALEALFNLAAGRASSAISGASAAVGQAQIMLAAATAKLRSYDGPLKWLADRRRPSLLVVDGTLVVETDLSETIGRLPPATTIVVLQAPQAFLDGSMPNATHRAGLLIATG